MACPSCEKNKLVQQGVTMVEQEETIDEDAQIDAVLEQPKKKSTHNEHADHVAVVMQAPPGCESSGCNQAAVVDIHDAEGRCGFRCSKHHMELNGMSIRLG